MATAEQLVSWAQSQIGIKEHPANSNIVKYWDSYKARCGVNYNGSPWCAAFVTDGMCTVGQWTQTSDEGRFRYCPSLVNWAKAQGEWLDRNAVCQPGDIILFANKGLACHVGIVEQRLNASNVQTIEGNTSVTSNDNGGAVMRRTRTYGTVGSSWYILGFVRPKWTERNDFVGWVRDEKGWWWRNADGSFPRECWQARDGYWYWFDADGYAAKGWRQINGKWYWFRPEDDALQCSMVFNTCLNIEGNWYAFNRDGAMIEGAIHTDESGHLILD